ncbi:tectonin domain-containing protein [Actinomadura bangladeshensis]|uniref:Tachylectin 2 domain-containing protein n=1 Tax=Actinomadura bangladeshensis TaxID=453573 RepID=A0A6L9QUF4_9ACTN|nr:tectonin domain-containing protein [Actinomadura bangladeshensis]NEA28748.1 hypothetical protein [Actinomadura bangladeshensis]
MSDPLPGGPIVQGQWKTITGNLSWLGGDRLLEWYPDSGRYRVWRIDYTITGHADPLPGEPVCEGTWDTIRHSHDLVYLGGDRVLDWEPGGYGRTPYRIWHFDRNVRGGDPFPGVPVAQGELPDGRLRYGPLMYLGGDRVMHFDTVTGYYETYRYDRTATGRGAAPFVGPLVSGNWRTIHNSSTTTEHSLIPLRGGRVLEIYGTAEHPLSYSYRLWRYDPDITDGDPLPGSPLAGGVWDTVTIPLIYIGQDRVLQSEPTLKPAPNDYRIYDYARDGRVVPGRSESWQIEVGADDSVWAVGDNQRLYRWDGAKWVQPTDYARAVQVTVGDCDHIWHLNVLGQVWHYLGEYWEQDGRIIAQSIAAAADFTIWAIGIDGHVLRRDGTVGSTWSEPTPYARGVQISVGGKDMVWHRNSLGQMWAWTGDGWNQIPGTALDISVAADGTACHVSPDNRLYRWVGGQWLEMPTDGRVAQVSVGGANNIWYVSLDNQIYYWSSTQFGVKTTLPT